MCPCFLYIYSKTPPAKRQTEFNLYFIQFQTRRCAGASDNAELYKGGFGCSVTLPSRCRCLFIVNSSLSSSQSCDRHTEG